MKDRFVYIMKAIMRREKGKMSETKKFMQVLHISVYRKLERLARKKGMGVQELIRLIAIEYLDGYTKK
jgi:hypothetical protein